MVRKIFNSYKDSFSGLSKEVWWLSLITFINRAGTMVLPFLSLYLTEYLNLSLVQVGWIMTSFGVGSLVGSYLGGKLSDRFGFYWVIIGSLLLTGLMFIGLQFVETFEGFVVGIFMVMVVADTFRPAMFVSLKVYSKPENRTRSLTLVRLAINLGFSFGPFLGGIIIASLDYPGLFWVDGITCFIAVILMLFVLKEKEVKVKKIHVIEVQQLGEVKSIYQDKPFWIFLFAVFLMAFMFVQLFSTVPLYYSEVHSLTEVQIGMLMSLNGFVIFLLEMPLIHYIEKKMLNKLKVITWSLVLFSLSYLILNTSSWFGVLVIGLLFITIGEMFAFPLSNNFAMSRAPKGKEGSYLGLFTMAFSFAHIFSAKTGMEIINHFGYAANWYFMGGLGALAIVLLIWLQKLVKA